MEDYKLNDGVLSFPEGLEYVLTESFGERLDIEKVILPSSLLHVGGAAFAGCENVKEVTFAGKPHLLSVDDGAFTLCHKLRHFPFPDSLETIGEMAFYETGLEEVHLTKVSTIEDNAFWNCPQLRSFVVENPDCTIGMDVLGDCQQLTEGFVAPGYSSSSYYNQADELAYTLLWLSHPEGHKEETNARAKKFIEEQEILIMEKIIDRNNTPAMTGLVQQNLLKESHVERYLEAAGQHHCLEITNLLLEVRRKKTISTDFGDLEL